MLVTAARSDHHDRHVPVARVGTHRGGELVAIHARHLDIQQHQVRHALFQAFQRFHAVAGDADLEVVAFEDAAGDLAHRQRVVDHHHQRHLALLARCVGQHRQRRVGEEAAHQRRHVQDHHHAAIAGDGGTVDARHRRDLQADRLDHDFAVAQHLVDRHGGTQITGTDQQQRHLVLAIGTRRGLPDQAAEVVQRIVFAAVTVAAVGGFETLARQAADTTDRGHRHREGGFADLHEHRLGDGQRLRQAQGEAYALAPHRLDVDRATELAHFVAHHVHAHATTGQLADLVGGGEAGREDQVVQLLLVRLRIGGQQATVDGAAADRLAVQASTVIGHFQHDFRTFAVQADGDLALLRLARGAALFRRFQAMGHGVAQHVFQRRDHAVEDVAVQFAVGSFQGQVDLLAGIHAGLADHAAQARHQAIERHHARAHQAILQLGADARLLLQQRIVLARQIVQHALQATQVGRRLVQRTAELLQGGEAVQLQRIELLVGLVLLALVAGDDLRLGFQVESPQLVAQSRIGALQFAHGTTEGAQLLFKPRAVDRHFTGMVDQAVEQVGTHAHLLLLRTRQRIFIDHALGRKRSRQRRFDRGRQWARGLCGHGLDLAGRTRGRSGCGDIDGGADLEGFDQILRRLHHAVRAGAGEQLVQAIEPTLQQLHVAALDLGTARGHRLQQRFDAVAKVADGVDASHACATLQGVQITLQAGQYLAVLRRIAQFADQAIAVVEQVLAFLDEDIDQFAVVHAEVECIGAVFGIRLNRCLLVVRRTRHDVGRCNLCIGIDRTLARCVFHFEEAHRSSAALRRLRGDLLNHRRRGRLIGALSFTDRRLPADVRILGKGICLTRREFAGLEADHGPLPVVVQGLLLLDHVQAGLERGCQRDWFCKTRHSHFILQARQLAVEWQCSSVVNDVVIVTVRIKRQRRIQVDRVNFRRHRQLFRVAVIHRQRTGVEVRRQIVRHGQVSVVDRRDRRHGI